MISLVTAATFNTSLVLTNAAFVLAIGVKIKNTVVENL